MDSAVFRAPPWWAAWVGGTHRALSTAGASTKSLFLREGELMRALILTKIYPNRAEPFSAPFNRQQFGELSRLCDVEILATIPWFPWARAFSRWSRAGRLGDVPATDLIDGLVVHHPRFAFVPKVGRGLSGPLYAASLAGKALRYHGR